MINTNPAIAVIGSGSWATALVKLLQHHGLTLHWWIRTQRSLEAIRTEGRNPKYLSALAISNENTHLTTDIREAVKPADMVLLAIPSYFLKDALAPLAPEALQDKVVISAIKGIVPERDQLVSAYLTDAYQVPEEQFVGISGPSHAEEVAYARETYLTLAARNPDKARRVAGLIGTDFLHIRVSSDVEGLEYAAVLKNVYAIAGGICNSLGYGDNFQAVLVASAVREIQAFLDTVVPKHRSIMETGYLGDLLVTAYSQFSRNRTFGNMIGKGYRTNAALMEMTMVPEGYYAIEPAYHLLCHYHIEAPILTAVHHILHDGQPAEEAMTTVAANLG